MFLRRLFAMLAKIAKADGKVDAWETHAAERAFARLAHKRDRTSRDGCELRDTAIMLKCSDAQIAQMLQPVRFAKDEQN